MNEFRVNETPIATRYNIFAVFDRVVSEKECRMTSPVFQGLVF